MNASQQTLTNQIATLTRDCGVVELPDCSVLSIGGDDRVRFLHNFCTADIKRLPMGHRCEAFFLNPKGRTIGHGYVLALDDRLIVWTVAASGASLLEHLDRYLLSEKVVLADDASAFCSLVAVGDRCSEVLLELGCWPADEQEFINNDLGHWFNASIAGPSIIGIVAAEVAQTVQERLLDAGAVGCTAEALNVVRVQAGTPWFGIDIDDRNLPQEVGRDEQAISFEKGCYLGQETVARLDALGHVNWQLRRLTLSGRPPAEHVGEIQAGGKTVIRLTSIANEPLTDTWSALGYVRSSMKAPTVVWGDLTVKIEPVLPDAPLGLADDTKAADSK